MIRIIINIHLDSSKTSLILSTAHFSTFFIIDYSLIALSSLQVRSNKAFECLIRFDLFSWDSPPIVHNSENQTSFNEQLNVFMQMPVFKIVFQFYWHFNLKFNCSSTTTWTTWRPNTLSLSFFFSQLFISHSETGSRLCLPTPPPASCGQQSSEQRSRRHGW